MQETWAQPLDWEDPLEKGIATHSNVLARRISWTEKPGGLQSMGSHRVRQYRATEQQSLYIVVFLSAVYNTNQLLYISPLPVEPPSSQSHPVQVITARSWAPWIESMFWLAICFTHSNAYMPTILSQTSSPLLCPLGPQVHFLCLCFYSFPQIDSWASFF